MHRKSNVAARILASTLALTLTVASAFADDGFAIRAKRVHTGDGAVIDDGVVVVRDGRIVSVGTAAPEGVPVHDHKDAVIIPGMVDIGVSFGALGQLSDAAHAVQPDIDAADAVDPLHDDFANALADGVTSAVLVPGPQNVVAGKAVAVRTGGPMDARGLAMQPAAHTYSIGSSVRALRFREPTSRMGSYDLMRHVIAGKEGGGMPAGTRSFVHCSDGADLQFLAREAGNADLVVFLSGAIDTSFNLGSDAKLSVVYGPLAPASRPLSLRTPGRIAAGGHRVAFHSGGPGVPPGTLRMTAALAVRNGFPAESALAAITSIPAEMAGIGDRVGSIAPGKAADLVVLSGEPLDLSSRVLDVYVGGRHVVHHSTGKE